MDKEKIVKKLFAKPVEDSVDAEKVWIHPLKYPVEAIVCIGRSKEAGELMRAGGSEDADVASASNLAYIIQEIMFVTRKGPQPDSEHFFNDSREVMKLGEDVWRLHEVYSNNFEATEEEMGESLRVNS